MTPNRTATPVYASASVRLGRPHEWDRRALDRRAVPASCPAALRARSPAHRAVPSRHLACASGSPNQRGPGPPLPALARATPRVLSSAPRRLTGPVATAPLPVLHVPRKLVAFEVKSCARAGVGDERSRNGTAREDSKLSIVRAVGWLVATGEGGRSRARCGVVGRAQPAVQRTNESPANP